MKRVQFALVAVTIALFLFQATPKASYSCLGTVSTLGLNPSGLVVASVGSLSFAYLCNVTATYNGVTAEVCKAIYAQLLAAKLNAQTVAFFFSDGLTCATHPAWADLTGWFYGPELEP
jgi:hypothetical protein